MFQSKSEEGFSEPISGIHQKTLVYGEKTLMTEFHLEKGVTLPRHSHPHEQVGYLVKGEMILAIGDGRHPVKPGDSWCIAGGVPHGAEIIEDCVAIEVFSPVREDYLPKNGRNA